MLTRFAIIVAAPLALAAATVFPALAAAPRTFVSGKGTDSGTCAVSTPCRSFAYAITQTAAAGEILVLDSAGYGPVTITQAVSIIAPAGIEGAITVPSGGTGITINAGTSDTVVLRGLTIDGGGVGSNGIAATQAQQLVVQECILQGMTGAGLAADSVGHFGFLIVNNVIAQNNGTGIRKTLASGIAFNSSIANSVLNHNGTGIMLTGGNSDIHNTTFAFNTTYGLNNGDIVTLGGSTFNFNGANAFAGVTTGTMIYVTTFRVVR